MLVDSAGAVVSAWRRWAGERGIGLEQLLAVAHGRPSRDVVHVFAPELDSQQEARRLMRFQQEAGSSAAFPGALECLAIAARGPWAIVTSGERELARGRLRAAGLPEPDVLVAVEDVRHGKPDPEPFLVGAARLGVDPAGCVVVEDAPSGIEAARRAGMTVLAVASTHAPSELGEADQVFDDLAAVSRWLQSKSAGADGPEE